MPEHFTGRQAEKSLLSNWLYNAAEPLLVLEAIGGMGKSALTWVWLHEEVLDKQAELDGVFWWSFYERPFESFVEQLYYYITAKEVMVERGALASGAWETLNSVLYENRFLLVLDGFERALRGYAGMSAMYIQEKGLSRPQAEQEEWDKRLREPVHPQAGKFLKALASARTITLMATRLFPTPLEDISGVQHESLTGLSRPDAVRFFKNEGIEDTRAEMERAAEVYDFHPLMLKQFSTALQRKRRKDINAGFELKLIDRKALQKILNKSFELLNALEKKVATTVSVLRSSFRFETAQTLFARMGEDKLWETLCELQRLGFLLYDNKSELFDFHPIMRSFMYDSLTARDKVHERAVEYFQVIPKPEKVVRIKYLAPVIELYHHLVSAGRFDEAQNLYHDRLSMPIYFQLANCGLATELLKELFPNGEDQPPRLKTESDQAWTCNELANSCGLSGHPSRAVPLFMLHNSLQEKNDSRVNLAIGLHNAPSTTTLQASPVTLGDGF